MSINLSQSDFDYIVIGSGFGGSVAAMRLSQKGYKVGVIESGKRWNADEFAKEHKTALQDNTQFVSGTYSGEGQFNLSFSIFTLALRGHAT